MLKLILRYVYFFIGLAILSVSLWSAFQPDVVPAEIFGQRVPFYLFGIVLAGLMLAPSWASVVNSSDLFSVGKKAQKFYDHTRSGKS